MVIRKYTGFFHDGSVDSIKHEDNNIEFILESADIHPSFLKKSDVEIKKLLSPERRIKIKLNVYDVVEIKENDCLMVDKMKIKYDNAEIFDLEIEERKIKLYISWCNYPPNPDIDDFSAYEIEAKKVEWERIE
jgi:hypothetical protein